MVKKDKRPRQSKIGLVLNSVKKVISLFINNKYRDLNGLQNSINLLVKWDEFIQLKNLQFYNEIFHKLKRLEYLNI